MQVAQVTMKVPLLVVLKMAPQAPEPASDHMPAAQEVHVLAAVAPTAVENVPAAQGVQAAAPVEDA